MASCYFTPKELFGAFKQHNGRKDEEKQSKGKPTFAEVVHGGSPSLTTARPTNTIPMKPTRVGNLISVPLDAVAFSERLASYSHLLLGKIYYSKGDTPMKIADVKLKLEKAWGCRLKKLVDLGRSWFQVAFHSAEEKNFAWGHGSLNLKPGMMRLQPWSADFNPETHRTTNVQVWVRFYINWIYWHPKILTDLASVLGMPLRTDDNTLHGEFGRYARLLVDVDLTEELPGMILLNKEGKEIEVPLWFENLPSFCHECQAIGHQRFECKKLARGYHVEDVGRGDKVEVAGPHEATRDTARVHIWRKKEINQQEEGSAPKEGKYNPEPTVEKGNCSKENEGTDLTEFNHYNIFDELAKEVTEEDFDLNNSEGGGVDEGQLLHCSDSEPSERSDSESDGEQTSSQLNICMDSKSASSSKKKKKWKRGRLTKAERTKRIQDKLDSGLVRPMTRASSNPTQ